MPSRWLVQQTKGRWKVHGSGQALDFPDKIAALTAALHRAGAQDELEVRDRAATVTLRRAAPGGSPSGRLVAMGLRPPEPHRRTARSVRFFAIHPQGVGKRIEELDREVSIETLVWPSGVTLALLGLVLQRRFGRKWWVLSLVALVVQAGSELTGRGPAVGWLRRRGFRRRWEIATERLSLRAIRGDFALFNHLDNPSERARQCIQLLA